MPRRTTSKKENKANFRRNMRAYDMAGYKGARGGKSRKRKSIWQQKIGQFTGLYRGRNT